MPTGEDVERMKDNVCDLVIVKQMEDESFVKYYTPNRCKWTKVITKTTNYEERKINEPSNSTGFQNNCDHGAGWKGELETFEEDGAYKIKWSSLVARPFCVKAVTLIDEENNLEKTY